MPDEKKIQVTMPQSYFELLIRCANEARAVQPSRDVRLEIDKLVALMEATLLVAKMSS